MAMLGRTVFGLGTGLSDAGYDPEVCRIGSTPRVRGLLLNSKFSYGGEQ